MKRVLIVSPSFPPVNAADMHRVRTSLPFFRDHSYEPIMLAIDPAEMDGSKDPQLLESIPRDVVVRRVRGVPERVTSPLGLRSAALRSLPSLLAAGSRIIRDQQVDLVYFSTTAFPVMVLGRYWRARHGVPYVLDFQDPWRSDYYREAGLVPPGGHLKYGLTSAAARLLEPMALRAASHCICVSPAYPALLYARYPWLDASRFTVLPFAAATHDFEVLDRLDVAQHAFDPSDGMRHWVYAGRAGPVMRFAVRAFFTALHAARADFPERFARLRLHFLGTDYATGDRAQHSILPIAEECGVADIVQEIPHRLPYFEVLRCLRDAEALIVPGSDDPGYTASKLFPYILADRPLLAIFHERSSVVDMLARTNAGTAVTFTTGEEVASVARRVHERWFAPAVLPHPATDWSAFTPYSAETATRIQCECFDRAIARHEAGR